MLGQLVYQPGGRGRGTRGSLYGMPVFRVCVAPDRRRGEGRLKRAARALSRQGIKRVLTPPGFDRWGLLEGYGLSPVDVLPLLRAKAAPLALAALRRAGVEPSAATVALLGRQADGDMARAARELCPKVRRLIISAPRGGEELAGWLHREYGVPVAPAGTAAHVALCFGPSPGTAGRVLELSGPGYELGGLTLRAPALEEGDRENLSLLCALWQGGWLEKGGIECT